MNWKGFLITAMLVSFSSLPLAAQTSKELDFLTGLEEFRTIREMLPNHLNRLANALLEERRRKIARISTPQDVAQRKAYVRERILHALGGLPERTPLNARVTGVLERDDYRIEKVIFESQPN